MAAMRPDALGELQEDQLRFMAGRWPDETAYRDLDKDEWITFREWDEQSNQLARGLTARGIEHGDRVSVYMPSEYPLRWIVAYAAVHKAGAVAVPGNVRLTARELTVILGHAEIRAAITCDALLPTLREIRAKVPSLELLVSVDGPSDDAADWHDVLRTDRSDYQVTVALDDLADIMYTSGTTGLPKGVAVRHRNVGTIPNMVPNWTGDSWLHGAPLFTFAGIAFIYNPMKMGLTAIYLPKFDAGRWLEIVERDRPAMTLIVPAMAELIVAHPDFERRDLSSLAMVSIGSAPVAAATQLALQARLPDAVVSNSYGMTEAGAAFIVMPGAEVAKRVGSVGKAIAPTETKIVDEAGDDCAPREVGEIFTRMPGKQREYYKDDAATASTWTTDGWLRSGDLGYLDEDGYLYIVGRKKDMIIRGGNNIYATDVEAAILEHPAVREVAVVGVPHDVLGEDVAAFVVRNPGAPLTDEQLKAFCAERLADYKRPRQITFVDELPRNATGKVMKHQLVHPAASPTGTSR